MDLKAYFESTKGHGVLATADASGRVNLAIFARPHVMEDNSVAFIMPHRLTHSNLQSNPQAAYLFLEAGPGYKGARLLSQQNPGRAGYRPLACPAPPDLCARNRKSRKVPALWSSLQVDKDLPVVGAGDPGAQ